MCLLHLYVISGVNTMSHNHYNDNAVCGVPLPMSNMNSYVKKMKQYNVGINVKQNNANTVPVKGVPMY